MAGNAAQHYAERSRHDRRVQLAKLGQDHGADTSVVVGLSLRLNGHQAHIDYTGGLDTTRLRPSWTSLRNLTWGSVIPRTLLPTRRMEDSTERREPREMTRARSVPGPGSGSYSEAPNHLWDALAQAAPVDLQRPFRRRRPGETAEMQQARIRAHDERKARDFEAVLARADTAAMARLARDLLEGRRRLRLASAGPVPLPRVTAPFFGGGHVFYVIRFWEGDGGPEGGVRWVMKIPAAGRDGEWDGLCRETLRAETFLLHKLRTETRIPVPEVVDADCSADNEVGVPWLLMEFVQGRRLEDVWFGLDMADGVRKQAVLTKRREAILRNVAGAMLQLGRYEFERGGAPCFDRVDGELVGAGPLRELDVQAMVDRWFLDEDCDTAPVYRGVGPWEDTGGMYTAWLDAYPPANESEKGVDELLRLLLKHVREPTSCRPQSGFPSSPPSGPSRKGSRMGRTQAAKEEPKTTKTNVKKFVLTHSDLSMRHILLAEDGTTIKAILGWDCAQAAPRSLGNEALPRWLARDFDPFVWAWRPPPDVCRVGHIPPECNRFEDPPWVLRELRGYYTRIIRELKLEGNGTQRGMDTTQGGYASNAGDGNREGFDADVDVDVDVDITKQSLLTLTLDAAIRDPRRRTAALRRLLEKCSRSFEELDFGFFIDNLGNGYEIDSMRLRCLANNVRELVDKGFVKGARGVL